MIATKVKLILLALVSAMLIIAVYIIVSYVAISKESEPMYYSIMLRIYNKSNKDMIMTLAPIYSGKYKDINWETMHLSVKSDYRHSYYYSNYKALVVKEEDMSSQESPVGHTTVSYYLGKEYYLSKLVIVVVAWEEQCIRINDYPNCKPYFIKAFKNRDAELGPDKHGIFADVVIP